MLLDIKNITSQFEEINHFGMYILGGWSILWLLISALGYFSKTGKVQHHFWVMNFFWVTINLVIVTASLFYWKNFSLNELPSFIKSFNKVTGLYIFNAGLDCAYLIFAVFLAERSRNVDFAKALQFKGFSFAITIQAFFLLIFDAVMALINQWWFNKHVVVYLAG